MNSPELIFEFGGVGDSSLLLISSSVEAAEAVDVMEVFDVA